MSPEHFWVAYRRWLARTHRSVKSPWFTRVREPRSSHREAIWAVARGCSPAAHLQPGGIWGARVLPTTQIGEFCHPHPGDTR
jgi:hypothetical protein